MTTSWPGDDAAHGCLVGDVEVGAAERRDLAAVEHPREVPAEHAATARDEVAHQLRAIS